MPTPRPYNEELADKICDLISASSKGLHTIIKENPDLPCYTTILKWLRTTPEFTINYARARDEQADFMADEIVRLSDEQLMGEKTSETKDGTFIERGDNVARSRLMVDSRKWVASKLKPKKYGDKMDVTTQGDKITTPTILNFGGTIPNTEAAAGAPDQPK